jgi:hypothetical protein
MALPPATRFPRRQGKGVDEVDRSHSLTPLVHLHRPSPTGNKRSQVTVIYTPHSNLKKTGDMATGSVSFHNDRLVKRVFVGARDNAVVNRLNRSKVVREVSRALSL